MNFLYKVVHKWIFSKIVEIELNQNIVGTIVFVLSKLTFLRSANCIHVAIVLIFILF